MKHWILTLSILLQTPLLASDDLRDLLRLISDNQGNKVHFVETRSASFLSQATVLNGTMKFTKSGDMVKHIDSPYPAQQRISGDLLIIQKSGTENTVISLSNYPALALGINAIRWILLGNLEKLDKDFFIKYNIGNADWTIKLTPKDKSIPSNIASVSITGYQGDIFYIKIFKSNGDFVLTTFDE